MAKWTQKIPTRDGFYWYYKRSLREPEYPPYGSGVHLVWIEVDSGGNWYAYLQGVGPRVVLYDCGHTGVTAAEQTGDHTLQRWFWRCRPFVPPQPPKEAGE